MKSLASRPKGKIAASAAADVDPLAPFFYKPSP
jgi:hypothetical protein